MSKEMLHSLIDLLPDADAETIYRVLIKFVPEDTPLPDEVEAIERGHREKASGEVENLENIDWD